MDEPVWIYVSIISVLIGIAVIVSLINQNTGHRQEQAFESAFLRLGPHCDRVCGSAPETMSPLKVDLPSGARLYTNGQKICGTYLGETQCASCECNLSLYELDLNTTLYNIHTFTCAFQRGENDIRMDCQG
jgi:hypothetical protein